MLTSLQRNVCRVWLVRMFGVLLMPLLAKVTQGCTTWKKGPCVIPFRVDGTLHTECLNRKACMIFASLSMSFFPPGRCLMNSPGSQRWDAKYISYLHHHYIFLIELKLHLSNTSDQRWFLCVQQALGETGRQPIGEGDFFLQTTKNFDSEIDSLLWKIWRQEFCLCHSFVFRLFQTLY